MKLTDGVIENPSAVFYDDGTPLLEHYGVMGMHWGVRNAETLARYSRDRQIKKAKKAEASEIKAARKKLAKTQRHDEIVNKQKRKLIEQDRKNASKNRALLSEAELDARIRRLQKEQLLRNLTTKEFEIKGKKAAEQALQNAGSEFIKEEGKKTLKKASKKITASAVAAAV